jgi:hypothetical protein
MSPPSPRVGLEWLARAGYGARGVVFLLLGVMTALAAADAYTRPVDSKEALRVLVFQPFGNILLFVVAAGLLCFALWRAAQALLDADALGADLKGLARRTVYGAASLFYLGFAFAAVAMALGARTPSSDKVVHDWTAWLLAHPSGQWIVGLAGVAVIASGLGIGAAGVRAEFGKRLALREKPRLVVTLIGCVGYLARAAVFTLIGLFLVFAAWHANAREATGIAGALIAIKRAPHGATLLAVTALGLFAFGAYGLAEAAFRRVNGACLERGSSRWARA